MSNNQPINPGEMWSEWFTTDAFRVEKRIHRMLQLLPHEPRCKFCHAPFKGVGSIIVRSVFGKTQSKLNPHFCNVCEEMAQKFPGGAEVEMSMLFADVRGSTNLSEQMSPSQFQQIINKFYVESTNAVIAEDGLVEKLAGDAIAAFWGAGFAGANYVQRTVKAAEQMSETMSRQHIPVGIGVHAGVAFFGAMGAADGLVDIAAIGDEVNLAARLASKAAAGEIIISAQALQQASLNGNELEARRLDLKGISEPVAVRVIAEKKLLLK